MKPSPGKLSTNMLLCAAHAATLNLAVHPQRLKLEIQKWLLINQYFFVYLVCMYSVSVCAHIAKLTKKLFYPTCSAQRSPSTVHRQHFPHRHQAHVASAVVATQPRSRDALPHRVRHPGRRSVRRTFIPPALYELVILTPTLLLPFAHNRQHVFC